MFFCRAIYFASVPYLPMLLASEKGISFDIISIILAINPLATVCTSFFGGALIDKFGIKRTSFFLVVILFLILFWCLKNFNTFDF
jgi:predicted MFS family arabinose efflux permease